VANAPPIPPPGFDDLTPEDKVRYVGSLWDRIVADQDRLPISDAQRALVRERLAAHLANPGAARPWSEVRRDIELTVSKRSPLLGCEFLDEFEHTTELIRETPLLSTLVEPPIRQALLKRFPYGVFFTPGTDDEPDVIVAVIDLRQDPDFVRHAYKR